MTREEAIQTLKIIDCGYSTSFVANGHIAMGMAIKALEQEPCKDAVSRGVFEQVMWERDVAIEQLKELGYGFGEKPRTGHWITKDGKEQGYDICGVKTWHIQIMCSECGFIKTAIEGRTGQYHYCPSCGAKMESEEQA